LSEASIMTDAIDKTMYVETGECCDLTLSDLKRIQAKLRENAVPRADRFFVTSGLNGDQSGVYLCEASLVKECRRCPFRENCHVENAPWRVKKWRQPWWRRLFRRRRVKLGEPILLGHTQTLYHVPGLDRWYDAHVMGKYQGDR